MSNKIFTGKGVRVIVLRGQDAVVYVNGQKVGFMTQLVSKLGCFYGTGIQKGQLWSGGDALACGRVIFGLDKTEKNITHVAQPRYNHLDREAKLFKMIPATLRKTMFNFYYIG